MPEIFNTFILLLLVAALLWVRDLLVSQLFWGLQLSNVPAVGRDGGWTLLY